MRSETLPVVDPPVRAVGATNTAGLMLVASLARAFLDAEQEGPSWRVARARSLLAAAVETTYRGMGRDLVAVDGRTFDLLAVRG